MFRRRIWIFACLLLVGGFGLLNGAAYLAARSMTHYVPNAERPHIHVPMTTWDKTRLFLGTLALPRPVNHLTLADREPRVMKRGTFPARTACRSRRGAFPARRGSPWPCSSPATARCSK